MLRSVRSRTSSVRSTPNCLFNSLRFCSFCRFWPPGQTPVPKLDVSSQEAVVFDHLRTLVRYEDDGTGVRDVSAAVRVQSQAGVQDLGQLVFGYSSATEKLEIDYVRVREADGQVIDTGVTNAQDLAPEVLRQAPTYSAIGSGMYQS